MKKILLTMVLLLLPLSAFADSGALIIKNKSRVLYVVTITTDSSSIPMAQLYAYPGKSLTWEPRYANPGGWIVSAICVDPVKNVPPFARKIDSINDTLTIERSKDGPEFVLQSEVDASSENKEYTELIFQ